LGWVFTRVRATEFLRDPERAMQPVFDKLQLLEILPEEEELDRREEPPIGSLLVSQSDDSLQLPPPPQEGLVDRVIRRADELRQEWNAA
jgi:hypothetical protein